MPSQRLASAIQSPTLSQSLSKLIIAGVEKLEDGLVACIEKPTLPLSVKMAIGAPVTLFFASAVVARIIKNTASHIIVDRYSAWETKNPELSRSRLMTKIEAGLQRFVDWEDRAPATEFDNRIAQAMVVNIESRVDRMMLYQDRVGKITDAIDEKVKALNERIDHGYVTLDLQRDQLLKRRKKLTAHIFATHLIPCGIFLATVGSLEAGMGVTEKRQPVQADLPVSNTEKCQLPLPAVTRAASDSKFGLRA